MNKDTKTTEYVDKFKAVKLSDSSRTRIANNLAEYARFHSVRVDGDSRSIEQVSSQNTRRTSLLNLFKTKSMTAAIIAIMLVAGGGTSYAAQGAVPGDFLYTIKTEVNENVKSAFAVSNEAEARLQARLAAERLEEAQELAERGELTAQVSADISARIKAHADEAEERSAKVEANGDYESSATVRANLEGNFRAYADILANLNGSVSGNNGASLVTDVRTYAESSANAQANATATIDASVDVKAAAEATIARTDNYIADVTTTLERAESDISAAAYVRAEARLTEAVAVQAEAKASFRAEAYRVAYTAAQTAVRIASEVETMIISALRIGIDLKTNVEIDTGRPGDPIPVIDITVEQSTDGSANTETDNRTEIDSQTETTSDRNSGSAVDVEADVNVDTAVDAPISEATSAADVSIGIGAGATNATDYNSSRSNKSY